MTTQQSRLNSGSPKKQLPVLRLTNKPSKLPVLKLTTYPNRPVKGATNIRVASKDGKKNA